MQMSGYKAWKPQVTQPMRVGNIRGLEHLRQRGACRPECCSGLSTWASTRTCTSTLSLDTRTASPQCWREFPSLRSERIGRGANSGHDPVHSIT